MKKLLSIGALLLTLTLSASAVQFKAFEFLSGFGVQMLTNTTVNFADTNVPYGSAANSNLVFSGTNTYVAANTSAFTNAYPSAIWGWGGTVVTNTATGQWPQAWYDVPVFADANGKVSDNYALTIVCGGTNSVSTNKLTFTFVGLGYAGRNADNRTSAGPNNGVGVGLAAVANSGSSPTFVVAVENITFTTNCVVRTNLPAALLQGCGGLRLTKVVSAGTVGGAVLPCLIHSVALEGFVP